jgi:hypothetical protein
MCSSTLTHVKRRSICKLNCHAGQDHKSAKAGFDRDYLACIAFVRVFLSIALYGQRPAAFEPEVSECCVCVLCA